MTARTWYRNLAWRCGTKLNGRTQESYRRPGPANSYGPSSGPAPARIALMHRQRELTFAKSRASSGWPLSQRPDCRSCTARGCHRGTRTRTLLASTGWCQRNSDTNSARTHRSRGISVMKSALHVRRALKRKDSLDQKKKTASSDALARTMVPGQVHTGMDSYTTSAVNPCLDSCAPSSEVPLDGAHKLWLGGLLHPIIVVCRRWWAGQQPLKPASFSQRRGPSGNSHLVVLSFCSGQVDYCVPTKEYY
jgi:hypothetical protein